MWHDDLSMGDYSNIKRARRLRRISNVPERIAWQTLRKLRPLGFTVGRQYPIESYIVDFAIRKTRLVIEIDGGVHNLEHVKAGDKIRNERLEALGWKVPTITGFLVGA